MDRAPELRLYTPHTRDENPGDFLRAIFSHNLGAEAVGFKIFVGQSKEAHDIILADHSIAKLLLRRSTVDAYVSTHIARLTGQWTAAATESSLRVSVNPRDLLEFDRLITDYFAGIELRLDETGQRYLTIRYEELVADEQSVKAIFDFLGIERGEHPLTPFTRRQNSEAIEDKVNNLRELIEGLLDLHRASR